MVSAGDHHIESHENDRESLLTADTACGRRQNRRTLVRVLGTALAAASVVTIGLFGGVNRAVGAAQDGGASRAWGGERISRCDPEQAGLCRGTHQLGICAQLCGQYG